MSFLVLAIASAGEGIGGVAKASSGHSRSSDGLLQTRADIDRLRQYCARVGWEMYGTLEVSGQVGTKEEVVANICRFFDECRRRNKAPVIAYSGHGERNTGNWCFPNGARITFADVADYCHGAHCSGYVVTVHADCCFSGNWVFQSHRRTLMNVVTASGPLSYAHDGVFSAAMYEDSASAKLDLAKNGGLCTRYDPRANRCVIEGITPHCLCCGRFIAGAGPMCFDNGKCCGYSQCQFFIDGVRCTHTIVPNTLYCAKHQK